jgi:CheY-like chemotaxis protein
MMMTPRQTQSGEEGAGRALPRVIVADDSTTLRHSMSAYLESSRLAEVVGKAVDGVDALGLIEKLAPDIAVMDVQMPNMDGLEATRMLKQRKGAPAVILVSLNAGRAFRQAAESAGADAFCDKADLSALSEALRHLWT